MGSTLGVRETKLLVASSPGTEDEVRPINLEGGDEECITSFKECGSVMEEKGGGEERVHKVARAFGALKGPTFSNSHTVIGMYWVDYFITHIPGLLKLKED